MAIIRSDATADAKRKIAPLTEGRPRSKPRVTRRSFLGGACGLMAPWTVDGDARGSSGWMRFGDVSNSTPASDAPLVRQSRQRAVENDREDRQPVRGGQLRLIRPASDTRDFNPAAFRQDYQVAVSYLDPLLRVDSITMEPRPWLATGWNWSDDGQTITYRLRPDVVWHDGTPFTAADVEFSLNVYRGDASSGVRNVFTTMQEVDVIDNLTLRVQLVEPDGTWLFNASTQLMFQRRQYADYWAASPDGARSLAGFDWQNSSPVGTGPWKIGDWSAERVEFKRNEGYWASPPYFERMAVQWESDAEGRLDAFNRGDVDMLWPVLVADVERLDTTSSRLYAVRSPIVMFAAFNFYNPERVAPGPLGDLRVRRALSFAVDRERYARQIYEGFISERIAGTIVQPWAHDDTVQTPRRDYEQSVSLLQEAGWVEINDDGKRVDAVGVPLRLTIIVRNGEPASFLATLEAVKRDWLDIGVDLAIEQLPPDRFVERWMVERDYDLIAYAYRLSPGFNDFDLYGSAWDIRFNPRGWNPGGYVNAEVDAAIQTALGAHEIQNQLDALTRVQQAANDDLFALWLGVPWDLVATADDIRGYDGNLLWPLADTRELWRDPSG